MLLARLLCDFLKSTTYLLDELGYSNSVHPVIYGDNQSAIHSIKNGIFRGTIGKPHIATKFFLASEMVRDGLVDLGYCEDWGHVGGWLD